MNGAIPRRLALGGTVGSVAAITSACAPAWRGSGSGDQTERPSSDGARASSARSNASPIIDAHCHVFNVDDLPVYRFLRHVVLPERCFDSLDALAWLVARFLKALAPGVDAERRVLGAPGRRIAPAMAPGG
jgi:hypothetical protein